MIYPYFLRCRQPDYADMIALLESVGVVSELTDLDTNKPKVCGINGNDFDLVFGTGQLWEGTGTFVTVDGVPTETKRLIIDTDGTPFIHVNINSRSDLRESLKGCKFCLLDADGYPRPPLAPQCTF